MGVDVRYGSLADILTSPRHVRFSPITDVERGGSNSRENPNNAHMAKVLTEDEARCIASNIAKLPALFGKGD